MTRRRCTIAGLAAALGASLAGAGSAQAQTARASGLGPVPTVVRTVPPVAGMTFLVAGRAYTTNAGGTVTMPLDPDVPLFTQVSAREAQIAPDVRAEFGRWYGRVLSKNVRATVGFRFRIRLKFSGPPGAELGGDAIRVVRLKSSTGEVLTFRGEAVHKPHWVDGTRVVALGGGLESKDIEYSVSSVDVRGADVVNRGEQRFTPSRDRVFGISTLWYRVRFASRDLVFGTPIGSSVTLTYPDGSQDWIAFGDNAEATVAAVPRGNYTVRVNGPGTSFERPLSLSKDQTVDLEMLSYVDMALFVFVFAAVAVGLLLVGRGRAWLHRLPRFMRTRRRRATVDLDAGERR